MSLTLAIIAACAVFTFLWVIFEGARFDLQRMKDLNEEHWPKSGEIFLLFCCVPFFVLIFSGFYSLLGEKLAGALAVCSTCAFFWLMQRKK